MKESLRSNLLVLVTILLTTNTAFADAQVMQTEVYPGSKKSFKFKPMDAGEAHSLSVSVSPGRASSRKFLPGSADVKMPEIMNRWQTKKNEATVAYFKASIPINEKAKRYSPKYKGFFEKIAGGGNTPVVVENKWNLDGEYDIVELDLDVNVHCHSEKDKRIVVSSLEEINDEDEELEESRGGYLWVNDDNDRDTGKTDTIIDMDDTFKYFDNDLEPVVYKIPEDFGQEGRTLEIKRAFKNDEVRIWQANKADLLQDGVYTKIEDFDADKDGTLWVEGLRSGSGKLTFTLKNGDEVLKKETVKLTIFKIAEVEWRDDGGSDVLPNPKSNPSFKHHRLPEGKRIFPDKTYASDTPDNRPQMIIKIAPVPPGGSGWKIPLFCKVFDVDHYADAAVIRKDFDLDSNSRDDIKHPQRKHFKPYDNRTPYKKYIFNRNGKLVGKGDEYHIGIKVLKSEGDNTILDYENTENDVLIHGALIYLNWVKFEITHPTPCNNWRVSASCAGDNDSSPFILSKSNGYEIEYISKKPNPIDVNEGETASLSSQTLTVWRKLYLEQDKMDKGVDFFEPEEESWHSIQGGDITDIHPKNFLETNLSAEVSNQWDFEGNSKFFRKITSGQLSAFVPLGTARVTGNSYGDNSLIRIQGNLPTNSNYVYVADDDVYGYGVDLAGKVTPIPKIRPSVLKNDLNEPDLFPAACIEIDKKVLSKKTDTIDFDLHQTDDEVEADVKATKDEYGDKWFWTVQSIYSYQHDVGGSADGLRIPNEDKDKVGNTFGTSEPFWLGGISGGVSIFIETIRDLSASHKLNFNRELKETEAHELGHLLGGEHQDGWGSLMSSDGGGGGAPFSGLTLLKFMLLQEKGPGYENAAVYGK